MKDNRVRTRKYATRAAHQTAYFDWFGLLNPYGLSVRRLVAGVNSSKRQCGDFASIATTPPRSVNSLRMHIYRHASQGTLVSDRSSDLVVMSTDSKPPSVDQHETSFSDFHSVRPPPPALVGHPEHDRTPRAEIWCPTRGSLAAWRGRVRRRAGRQ